MSEMYIPTSLWESTRHMKYQIFEAMDAQQLNEMMVQVFTEKGQAQFQFIVPELNVLSQLHSYDSQERQLAADQERTMTTLSIQVSPIQFNVNAYILNDLQHFLERMNSTFLIRDLKQYRPHRHPITEVPENLQNKAALKRKRKLIVRDWFFFVVWYIRLRKIIRSFYSKEGKNAYMLFDPKYSQLLQQVMNKEVPLDDVIKQIQAAQQPAKNVLPYSSQINLRLKSADLRIYNDQLFDIQVDQDCPKVSIKTGHIALGLNLLGVPSKERSQEDQMKLEMQLGAFEVHTYKAQKSRSLVKPRQLSALMLKQEIMVQQSIVQSQRPPLMTPNKGIPSLAHAYNRTNANNPRAKQIQQHRFQNNNSSNLQGHHQQYRNLNSKNSSEGWNEHDSELGQAYYNNTLSHQGRLMIGPKVSTNEIMLGPQQRSAIEQKDQYSMRREHLDESQTGAQGAKAILKKSASKDSLMQNMLSSVTKFLGGAVGQKQQTQSQQNHQSFASRQSEQLDSDGNLLDPMFSVNSMTNSSIQKPLNHIDANNIQVALQPENQPYRDVKVSNMTVNKNFSLNLANKQNQQSTHALKMSHFINNAAQSSQNNFLHETSQMTGNRGSKQQSKTKGLEALLKGGKAGTQSGQRTAITRSFNNNIGSYIHTENGENGINQADISYMIGQAQAIQQLGVDEDIVMDSGGRQINHLNNWVDSQGRNLQMSNQSNLGIQDGIRNKNLVRGRATSTIHYYENDDNFGAALHQNNDDRIVNSPATMGVTSPPANSTLSCLLGSGNHIGKATNPNQTLNFGRGGLPKNNVDTHSHRQGKGLLTTRDNSNAQPNGMLNPQIHSSQRGSTQPITSSYADTNCNVLQSSIAQRRPMEGLCMVKEQLFKMDQIPAKDNSSPVAQVEYKLVHDRRLVKEVQSAVNVGKLELTYSNNSLATIAEILISCKSLPAFRDVTLIPDCLLPKGAQISITPESARQERDEAKKRAILTDTLLNYGVDQSQRNSNLGRAQEKQSGQTRLKAKQVTHLLQKCAVDLKVTGDRLYISFFDDQSRDQLAKFVSPQVSLALQMHTRENPQEARYEVFGFLMQQSTDLNLLANFASLFYQQIRMLSSHESIRRGQVFYSEMLDEQRKKADEKRIITQKVFLKQSQAMQSQYSTKLADSSQKQPLDEDNLMATIKAVNKPGVGKNVGAILSHKKDTGKPHMMNKSSKVMKPGASISKLGSKNTSAKDQSNETLKQVKQDLQNRSNQNTMVSKGLLIEECPSKEMNRESDASDNEDVPYPEDDEEESEPSGDVALRDQRETEEQSDKPRITTNQTQFGILDQTPEEQQLILAQLNNNNLNNSTQIQLNSYGSANQDYDTFQGDNACYDPPMDVRDMQNPKRAEINQLIHVVDNQNKVSVLTNNSNLREATALSMTQGYVQIGGINRTQQQNNNSGPSNNFGYPMRSNTHTDSAGGEAQEHDSDMNKNVMANQSQPAQVCDQDEPLLLGPGPQSMGIGSDNQDMQNQRSNTQNSQMSDANMQIFEDTAISNGVRTSQKKQSITLERPPGLNLNMNKSPHGLPAGPTRGLEESKKWKSTREAQTYQFRKGPQTTSSKLFSLKDAGVRKVGATSPLLHGGGQITPNNLLNFSKQLGSSHNIREDLSPSIRSQPLMQRLKSQNTSMNNSQHMDNMPKEPHSTFNASPSKKHIAQNQKINQQRSDYNSQKQLQEVIKMNNISNQLLMAHKQSKQ